MLTFVSNSSSAPCHILHNINVHSHRTLFSVCSVLLRFSDAITLGFKIHYRFSFVSLLEVERTGMLESESGGGS